MVESWAAFSIFQAFAFFLFLFVVIRTIYRCYTYHDCCRRCRKRHEAPPPKPAKPSSSFASELQNVGGGKNSEEDSMKKVESELFDPSRPLELPVHGIHYPDPLEEASEAGSAIGPGGHNLDFTVENVGYDEPDEKRNLTNSSEAPAADRPEGEGIFEVVIAPSWDSSSLDKDNQLVPGVDGPLPEDGELVPDAGSQLDTMANTESEQYQDSTTTDAAAVIESEGLVTEENSGGAFGIDNISADDMYDI